MAATSNTWIARRFSRSICRHITLIMMHRKPHSRAYSSFAWDVVYFGAQPAVPQAGPSQNFFLDGLLCYRKGAGLSKRNTVLLTRSMEKKFRGDRDPKLPLWLQPCPQLHLLLKERWAFGHSQCSEYEREQCCYVRKRS